MTVLPITTSPLDMLQTLQLDINDVVALFTGLAKIPQTLLDVILKTVDPVLLKRIAEWAQVFMENLNKIQVDGTVDVGGPMYTGDFLQSAANTRYVGQMLTPESLQQRCDAMTSAIKVSNWIQAIQVGISIGQLLVTAAV